MFYFTCSAEHKTFLIFTGLNEALRIVSHSDIWYKLQYINTGKSANVQGDIEVCVAKVAAAPTNVKCSTLYGLKFCSKSYPLMEYTIKK
jgi:hypothetical protein